MKQTLFRRLTKKKREETWLTQQVDVCVYVHVCDPFPTRQMHCPGFFSRFQQQCTSSKERCDHRHHAWLDSSDAFSLFFSCFRKWGRVNKFRKLRVAINTTAQSAAAGQRQTSLRWKVHLRDPEETFVMILVGWFGSYWGFTMEEPILETTGNDSVPFSAVGGGEMMLPEVLNDMPFYAFTALDWKHVCSLFRTSLFL